MSDMHLLSIFTSRYPPTISHHQQVDAVKNISVPIEHRDKAATPGAGRCLLLALSDGAQRAVGMEYAPIPDLRVDLPPGIKVGRKEG